MGDIVQIIIIIAVIAVVVGKQFLQKLAIPEQEYEMDVPPETFDFPPVPAVHNLPPIPDDPYNPEVKRTTRPSEPKDKRLMASAAEPEEDDTRQEFDIHSIEEVRRGIIWSEILNRKY